MMRSLWMVLAVGASTLGCSDHASHAGEGHDEHAGEAHDAHAGEAQAKEGEGGRAKPGEDEHAEEEGVVRLGPAAIARSGVRVAAAVAGALGESVEVSAEVQLNPDRVAHISPLVDGQLLSVEVALGDDVIVDQPLAQMRSVGLGQARAELNRTAALRRAVRRTLQRQKRLRKEGIASERSYLAAQLASEQASAEYAAAKSRLRVFGVEGGAGPDMHLTSPIAGRIVERHATRGENTSPDDTLFVVADLGHMWIIGHAYEQQISQITPGMPATLTLNAYPGRTWTGAVNFIGAQIEKKTRTLPLRVEIDNKDGLLRPGLFGTLRLAKAVGGAPIAVIPMAAVQTLERRSVVFVPGDAPGEFAAKVVTLGRESRGRVEVIKGLAPGEPYVADGAFVLKSELVRSQLGHGHAH
ncbi:MAG: cobalt-zinc-cadmium efflux system membrane fusion protein [Bradymonadia bacterium]|jgi:cobalt-zinc-cadmium efflux system membrane fusion protein